MVGSTWRLNHRRSTVPTPRSAPQPMGKVIRILKVDSIDYQVVDSKDARVTQCKFVASYSLLSSVADKTILVPGSPPRWSPPNLLRRLIADARRLDMGPYYRDDNAVRFPKHMMEPSARSIFSIDPAFNGSAIDICGCASTLGNLLRYATQNDTYKFSLVVHVVGSTAFFIRRERSPDETIEGIAGYGHAFLDEYTSWDPALGKSASHQRLVKYNFAGLVIVVRFETDASLVTADTSGTPQPKESCKTEEALDSIKDEFRDLMSMPPPSSSSTGSAPVVKLVGAAPPQASLVDVKTRRAGIEFDRHRIIAGEIPRLWIRQVTNLVLAFHDRGKFDIAWPEDLSKEIRAWEDASEENLRRFGALLGKIISEAKATKGGKIEVRGSGYMRIELRDLSDLPADEWSALPEELQKSWTAHESNSG